jgi:FlaA1/EpsC-like NDP-sugar epimerase
MGKPASAESLIKTLYAYRRAVTLAIYGGVAAVAYTAAYLLRFEFALPAEHVRVLLLTLPVLVGVRMFFSALFNLASARWRFTGTSDILRLTGATILGSFAFIAATVALPALPLVSPSIILIEAMLTMYLTAALWLTYRTGLEQIRRRGGSNGHSRRVLIVGAGEAGSLLAREMSRGIFGYTPVGFVDDDPAKQGTRIHGLPVWGPTGRLSELTARHNADEVVVAVPSASPADLRRLVEACERSDTAFKVLPGIADVLTGEVALHQLRDLRIEDLLGREPVQLELPDLRNELQNRSVLITGAAGSIGSELARQVALHSPGWLLLLDQSETGLFYLERDLRETHPELNIVTIVGDIIDEVTIERVFERFRPSRVFHAAAYKHVSMMQCNLREAIRNNVLGTQRVAAAAGRHGAGKFVLVSTDKAVRPTSVMGATKRLAEIRVLQAQRQYPETTFSAVRFGNVLGSSGSVIPIFREQLAAGRPLTVTHPDVTRYFMTIPEAVQLILKASVLPEMRGQIAMLDMGEPVRIVDLARNLLRISGHAPRTGHKIVFTGLRQGEKLHEELIAPDERAVPTTNPKVSIVCPAEFMLIDVDRMLDEWEHAFMNGQEQDALESLTAFFPSLVAAPSQVEVEQRPALPA